MNAAAETREQWQEQVHCALEHIRRNHERAAVIVIEVDGNYAARANERMQTVLARWRRHRCEQVHACRLGRNRYTLVVAPVGTPAQVRALAEELTRSLDPRICPLLRRALTYAWFGLGVWPDDGSDVGLLLARADQALERSRNAGIHRDKILPPRRRFLRPSLLQAPGMS